MCIRDRAREEPRPAQSQPEQSGKNKKQTAPNPHAQTRTRIALNKTHTNGKARRKVRAKALRSQTDESCSPAVRPGRKSGSTLRVARVSAEPRSKPASEEKNARNIANSNPKVPSNGVAHMKMATRVRVAPHRKRRRGRKKSRKGFVMSVSWHVLAVRAYGGFPSSRLVRFCVSFRL